MVPGHQPRVSKALKWLLAELPRARQNRFLSAGHGHSCQSVGAPASPPGGPPGPPHSGGFLGDLETVCPHVETNLTINPSLKNRHLA